VVKARTSLENLVTSGQVDELTRRACGASLSYTKPEILLDQLLELRIRPAGPRGTSWLSRRHDCGTRRKVPRERLGSRRRSPRRRARGPARAAREQARLRRLPRALDGGRGGRGLDSLPGRAFDCALDPYRYFTRQRDAFVEHRGDPIRVKADRWRDLIDVELLAREFGAKVPGRRNRFT